MNLEKFLTDIGRIADALDRLADLKRDGVVALPADRPELPQAQEPVAPPAESPANPAAEKLRRETLKAQLRERGIPFAAAARVATLEALLANAPQTPPAPPAEAKVEQAATPAQEPATPVTIDDARAALTRLSLKRGREFAMAVMHESTGLRKVSEMSPEQHAALVARCEKEMQ